MRLIFTFVLMGFATAAQASPQEKMSVVQLQNLCDKQQDELRQLRGQVDELNHQLKRLQANNERAAVDQPQPKPAVKAANNDTPKTQSSLLADQPTNSSGSRASVPSNSTHDYNEARTLLDQRHFAEAEVALTQFIKKYPKDPMLVNAYYWLAETHYIRSDYTQAALKFGEAYQAYMDHKGADYKEQSTSKGPEIIFKLASSLYNIGKFEDAKVTLEELSEEFPKIPGNIRQQVDLLRREIARKATAG